MECGVRVFQTGARASRGKEMMKGNDDEKLGSSYKRRDLNLN